MSTIAKVTIKSGQRLVLKYPGPPGPPGASSGGDVVGPGSATAGNVAVMSDGTGKVLADGGQTPAQLKDRANHTGAQAIATVTGLQDALDAKEVAGAASTLMSVHTAALDPHTQYTTAGEAAAAAPVQSVAGKTGNVTLVKADVGLGSVDNTADTAKPVSTAQQTALDGKEAIGVAATALAAHVAAADPHPLYALDSDLAGKANTSHTHNASDINAGTLAAARMPAHTGDVTSSAGAIALTIASAAVTYSKIQNVSATSRILGRKTSGAGSVEELTGAEAQAIITPTTTRGDIIVRGASADGRLAIGPVASIMVSDGTDAKWLHPSKGIQYTDHFIGAGSTSWCLGWLGGSNVGNGFTVAIASTTDAPGILASDCGTSSASGDRTLTHETLGAFILGNGLFAVEWRIKIPTLSTASETFTIRVGTGKGNGSAPTDGFWFEYSDGVNSGNWRIVSAKASSSAAQNTAVAATTGWVKLAMIANAAGTNIDYYINGTLVGSVTDTSKIPTTAPFSLWTSIRKSVNTAARQLYHDYVALYHEFTTPL